MKKFARSLGALTAAVAFGAGSALLAPAAGAQSSLPFGSAGPTNCETTEFVTPQSAKSDGWFAPTDESDAKIGPVTGAPAHVGTSALTYIGDPARGTSLYKNADATPIKDLLLGTDGKVLPISYDYTASGQAPALQIRLLDASIDKEEDKWNNGFATIVWSPEASDGEWKVANPGDSDQFFVTRTLVDENGVETLGNREKTTLKEIIDLNPDAKVIEYGVQQTKENTSTAVAIDNFKLGCEVTNFELKAPAAETPGSLENIFGSVTGIFQS